MNAFGEGLLTLPDGTFRLKDLSAVKMQRNGLGAVKVGEGPPLIRYRLEFDPPLSIDKAPDNCGGLVHRKKRHL
jgi:hypothetical protein